MSMPNTRWQFWWSDDPPRLWSHQIPESACWLHPLPTTQPVIKVPPNPPTRRDFQNWWDSDLQLHCTAETSLHSARVQSTQKFIWKPSKVFCCRWTVHHLLYWSVLTAMSTAVTWRVGSELIPVRKAWAARCQMHGNYPLKSANECLCLCQCLSVSKIWFQCLSVSVSVPMFVGV